MERASSLSKCRVCSMIKIDVHFIAENGPILLVVVTEISVVRLLTLPTCLLRASVVLVGSRLPDVPIGPPQTPPWWDVL